MLKARELKEQELTSVLEGAMKFKLYSSTSYVMVKARSSTSYTREKAAFHFPKVQEDRRNTEDESWADLVLLAFVLLHVRAVFPDQ